MTKKVILGIYALIFSIASFAQTEFKQYEANFKKELAQIGVPEENYTDANVFGHVVDKITGEHIPFVHILVEGTNTGTATNESGHYMIVNLPVGKYTLKTQAMGYKSKEITVLFEKGITKEVNFELDQDYIQTEGIVVTANRNEVSRKDATNVVNVLASKMLERTQSANIAEGLNFQPGVRIENNCQNCGFTQLRMNGMEGPYTQILIDGHPVMSALSGVYGLEQIPTSMIDRVEVVRGGGSVLYGANAIAGTINIITKEPTRNTFEASASVGIIDEDVLDNTFSFNTSLVTDDLQSGLFLFAQYRDRDSYNANPDDLWDADGDGVAETKDDFSEMAEMKNTNFGMRAYHRLNQYSKVSLEYHHLGEFRRGGNKFELPPHLADIAEQIRSNVNGGSISYDWLSKDLKHEMSFFNSMQYVDRETYYGAEMDPNAYGFTTELTNITGVQYTGHYKKFLFAKALFTAGAEYKYSDLKDDKLNGTELLNISDQEINNVGAYAESEWDMDDFKVKIGGRIDKHTLVDDPIFSPRANILVNVNANTQLRANYAQGFRAPQIFSEDLHIEVAGADAVRTYNSDDLTEERSESFSLSLDNTSMLGTWQTYFLAESFYTTLDDQFVEEITQDEDGTAIMVRTNGSGAKVYGINLEGKIAPSNQVSLTAGWTLQKSEYTEEEVVWESEDGSEVIATDDILRTPDSYGYFLLTYDPSDHWKLALNGNYSGEMKVPHMVDPDTERTIIETSDPYFDLGLKIERCFHLKSSLDLSVYAGVKNLFDNFQDDFDAGVNRDAGYIYGPSAPRMIYFGVNIKNL